MADGPQVVILAAGQGTRMRSAVPKVLHPLGGRPLLLHSLDLAAELGAERPLVIVNPDQPQVLDLAGSLAECIVQVQPLGTGDAVRNVPAGLRSEGSVVVLSADVPLIRAATLRRLLAAHDLTRPACTLLTCVPEDPSGLGRVLRDERGAVTGIVEEGDIPPDTVVPLECNAGVYVFTGSRLWPALDRLRADNAQGEYYLTDVIELFDGDALGVVASDPGETLGVNDRRQLAAAEAVLRRRTLDALMVAGVTIEDPATTYVDAGVRIGPDSLILPLTTIRGQTQLGAGCVIGPLAQLRDVRGGDRLVLGSSLLEDCVLGEGVRVGAFCRVRPNSVLGSGVELGTHAEVKNSTIGAGTRINHFACVLDSDVGRDANIGAGTVTCNYDGAAKHRTSIGDGVFVGTNTTLVAPLRLGDGSYVGAGSFVNSDVPAGALAVGRARQRNVEGWATRHRPARA